TSLPLACAPRHLGARIGITAVLHTWGSALTHHPHVHMIVPGGGLSEDGGRWISSRPGFLVPVKVLSRLFRGRLLAMLAEAHAQHRLCFFGDLAALADKPAFKRFLAPLRRREWVVYTKQPFAGPEQVLRYLSRYTHRVAISNRRLVAADANAIAFRWKDYRINGPDRWKTMTLSPHECIRRFLIHVLPKGFHRIRHYGLFPHANRPPNAPPRRHPRCASAAPAYLRSATAGGRLPHPRPTHRCSLAPGRAGAPACSSSGSSRAAANPDIGHPRLRPRSAATRHARRSDCSPQSH